jgi:CBS domain containing-hemolysin-like protein
MPETVKVLLEILLVLALVAANGFFVAAEFALVKVRASQLRPMAKTGGWRVKFALFAIHRLDAVLSATQLGITLTSLGLGWVGEPFIARRLTPFLSDWGITDTTAVHSISFSVAFVLITFLHIVFGEQAPKMLAIQHAKAVTLWLSPPLVYFYRLFFPFIWLLNGAANQIAGAGSSPPAKANTPSAPRNSSTSSARRVTRTRVMPSSTASWCAPSGSAPSPPSRSCARASKSSRSGSTSRWPRTCGRPRPPASAASPCAPVRSTK